jgi:hypothetical protein
VLEDEGRDQRRQDEPAPIESRAQRHAGKRDQRGIGLQHALDIPLAVELAQSPLDRQRMAGKPADAFARGCLDAAVDGLVGIALHAVDCGHHAAPRRKDGWQRPKVGIVAERPRFPGSAKITDPRLGNLP